MKKTLILFLFIVVQISAKVDYTFQNPQVDIEKRIDDLLQKLTIEEKISFMQHESPEISRLDIPKYNWWNECLHGVGRAGKATVFPQAIGLAATFDENLIFKVATAISDEARAKYNAAIKKNNRQQYMGLTFWSPNVNIFRDPRWGRGQETYGEDPFLTSKIGVAFVKGLQGNDKKYLKTSACAKHFVVHSGPEESRHRFNVKPSSRDYHETYLPAFKALVDCGVESVMCAYNRLEGEPCCGSNVLLYKLLRETWGFKGHIVTDCGAINDIWKRHKTVDQEIDASVMALKAGVNLNCGSSFSSLNKAIKLGMITEADINKGLRPLLRTRIKLGLLEDEKNNPYSKLAPEVVNCKKHINLAYESALKSIVMLKNKDNILPLNLEKIHKLYLTGPTAANNTVLYGNYNGFSGNFVTILEGLINKIDVGTVLGYNKACLLNSDNKNSGIWEWHSLRSDVIIVSLGLSRFLEGEGGDAMLNTNGGDRVDTKLPENQIQFLRDIKKKSKNTPIVVVITGGSAISLPEVSELADAILFAWYPGEQGGNAVADIIFGNKNPSGRLPVTFYNTVEDLPEFDNYSMENRTYKYFKGDPLYSFGYGLSYSNFIYSNLKIEKKIYKVNEKINILCNVKNNSKRLGDEVVQLYVTHLESNITVPIKALKGFKRITLKENSEKKVSFTINIKDLAFWNETLQDFKVEKGKYLIQIGASSKDIKLQKTIVIK